MVRSRPSPVKEIGLTSQADHGSVIRTMRYSIARIGFLMRLAYALCIPASPSSRQCTPRAALAASDGSWWSRGGSNS
jgi:hypothetical protein